MAEKQGPQAVSIVAACAAPADLAALACAAGEKKAKANYFRMFISAIAAGLYIGVGGICSVAFGKGLPTSDAGMQKFAFGAVFPVGLIIVVLTGSELVTGNFAVLFFAFLNRRINFGQLLLAWLDVYFGNFVGSLAAAYFLAFLGNLFVSEPYLSAVQAMAESKTSQDFGALIMLGIGCNWLVCLGVVMAMGARDFISKIAIIWFPIQTFVTIGFEHCVANMSLVPIGLLYGADVSFGGFVIKNLIPVTIGNILGGVILVALLEWYLYGIDKNVWKFDLRDKCCCKKTSNDDLGSLERGNEESSTFDLSKSPKNGDDDGDVDDEEEEEAGGTITDGKFGFQKLQSTSTIALDPKKEKAKKSKKSQHKQHRSSSTHHVHKHDSSRTSSKKLDESDDIELHETAA